MESIRVPHREPMTEGEGPCNWVAMWNMPGYLPEMEPAFFEHFDDAKRYILNELGEIEDDEATAGNDDIADEISGIRQDINLESDEFSVVVGNYAYSVERVD